MKATRPSSSAQTVALARAHLHTVGVIDDPYALGMLTRRRRQFHRVMQMRVMRSYGRSATFSFLAARTHFFDEAVFTALADGVNQVVIVGAGYDTRALRLARPGVRFFEVDHPATQSDKRRRARDAAVYVPVDLTRERLDDHLGAEGHDASLPSVFIVEGVTMYLPEDAAAASFAALARAAAPGSKLAVNFTARGGGSVSPASRAVAWLVRASWSLTGEETFHWATYERVDALLPQAGWQSLVMASGPELAERYLATTVMNLEGVNADAFCVLAERMPAVA